VERTLNRVNQTQLADNFDVTLKIINRKAKDLISLSQLSTVFPHNMVQMKRKWLPLSLDLLYNKPKPLPPWT